MIETRRVAVPIAIAAAALVSSCGPHRIRAPERPEQTLVVLTPDGGGTVGQPTASKSSGTADLSAARESTTVSSANQPPAPVTVLSEEEVQRLFGDALSALPPPPQRFTLN